MVAEIAFAKSIPIRDAGYDEYWLQDQIVSNPMALAIYQDDHQNSGYIA